MLSMFPRARVAAVLLGSALLAGCAGTGMQAIATGLGSSAIASGGTVAGQRRVTLFVASNRGDAGARPRFSLASVGIPPGHRPGVIERPHVRAENPARHFVFDPGRPLEAGEFGRTIGTHLSGRVGAARDVLVFVHGYNTSHEEAVFRTAQLVADSGFTGVPVTFSWNSRESLLGYGADRESASIARDRLEQTIAEIAAAPGLGRLHIIGHSMGGWVTMETLRQFAIAGRADLDGRLGEVMLAHPDIDLDVFRAQLARTGLAARVSLFTAADDRALALSRRLAGSKARAGAIDLADPGQRDTLADLGVRVYDLTAQSGADTFRHGTFAEAPNVVRVIGSRMREARVEEAAPLADYQPPEDKQKVSGAAE